MQMTAEEKKQEIQRRHKLLYGVKDINKLIERSKAQAKLFQST